MGSAFLHLPEYNALRIRSAVVKVMGFMQFKQRKSARRKGKLKIRRKNRAQPEEFVSSKNVARVTIQMLKMDGNNKKAMVKFDHCLYSSNKADRLSPRRGGPQALQKSRWDDRPIHPNLNRAIRLYRTEF